MRMWATNRLAVPEARVRVRRVHGSGGGGGSASASSSAAALLLLAGRSTLFATGSCSRCHLMGLSVVVILVNEWLGSVGDILRTRKETIF